MSSAPAGYNVRVMWEFRGKQRPEFAIVPEAGQESVWDYPRPPVLKPCDRLVEVKDGERTIVSTRNSFRLLETASPPTFYIPLDDVEAGSLVDSPGSSFCEWKGNARYQALATRPDIPVAWGYPNPSARYDKLRNYISFYPGRIACYVDGYRVAPQPGHFYGGWVTPDVVGPFKGDPGTGHW